MTRSEIEARERAKVVAVIGEKRLLDLQAAARRHADIVINEIFAAWRRMRKEAA